MYDDLKLLTMDEVAEILRVHRATVSRLLASGALSRIEVGSRKLVRESDLRAFIESQIAKNRSATANESRKEG